MITINIKQLSTSPEWQQWLRHPYTSCTRHLTGT